MPIEIEFKFPTGFIHATPWRSQINEGKVEWPLSPWRLLRALISVWKVKCSYIDEPVIEEIIANISKPPEIWLAPKIDSSIRNYVPGEKFRTGQKKPDKDLIVDGFGAVDPSVAAIAYRWDTALSQTARDALSELVSNMGYFGRAESLCEGHLKYGDDDLQRTWIKPNDYGSSGATRVLAPKANVSLADLCETVRDMRKDKRLDPLASQWLTYSALPEPEYKYNPPQKVQGPVSALRFTIQGVRPSVFETVSLTESFRRAIMSRVGRENEGKIHQLVSGKLSDGSTLKGNQHAHWLALDTTGDKLIDSLYVWVPGSIPFEIAMSMANLRTFKVFTGGSKSRDLEVSLTAFGNAETVLPYNLNTSSSTWKSVTPFAPQRHIKRQSVSEFILDCVKRELGTRGFPTDDLQIKLEKGPWGKYKSYRQKDGINMQMSCYGVVLEFSQQVRGPISIGSLSHFGLGLFRTLDRSEKVSELSL